MQFILQFEKEVLLLNEFIFVPHDLFFQVFFSVRVMECGDHFIKKDAGFVAAKTRCPLEWSHRGSAGHLYAA
jgi:hypothetical protein